MGSQNDRLGWLFALALLAAPVASPAVAQGLFYKPMPLMGSGYSDKLRAPGRWWVRGFAAIGSGGDLAVNLALYRGALLMKAGGFSHFMVVDGRIVVAYGANANAEFTIVGAHSAAEVIPCEAKPAYASNCRMLSVEETIVYSGPQLFRTPEQTVGDLSEARTRVAAAASPGKRR